MQKRSFAFENASHKDAQGFGAGENQAEEKKDLQNSGGCHSILLRTAPDAARRTGDIQTNRR
jgi:hypothetical protein